MLSDNERRYIANGLNSNCRVDGRHITDYRDAEIEIDVFPRANGSSICTLGDSKCIVQIIGDVVERFSGKNYEVVVDKRSDINEEQLNDIKSVLSHFQIELPEVGEKFQWFLTIKVSFTAASGNIVDCCFLALKCAIATTLLPKIKILNNEIEVVDDINLCKRISNADSFPIACSVLCISGNYCVDPCEEEILAGTLLLHIILSKDFCKIVTTNSGICSNLLLRNMIKSGKEIAHNRFEQIVSVLSK